MEKKTCAYKKRHSKTATNNLQDRPEDAARRPLNGSEWVTDRFRFSKDPKVLTQVSGRNEEKRCGGQQFVFRCHGWRQAAWKKGATIGKHRLSQLRSSSHHSSGKNDAEDWEINRSWANWQCQIPPFYLIPSWIYADSKCLVAWGDTATISILQN